MNHSTLSPSGADQWSVCTASVALRNPDKVEAPNFYADEGTAAHSLLDMCLKKRKPPVAWKGQSIGVERPGIAKQAFEVTDDMIDAVEVATDYVSGRLSLLGKKAKLLTDLRVKIKVLNFNGDEGGGTLDVAIIYDTEIEVIDYKHGRGVLVEAKGNRQMALYALGLLPSYPNAKTIRRTIIQPRAAHAEGPVRSETISVKALLAFEKEVASAVEAIKSGRTAFAPGEKQCQWCDAKATCPALGRKVLEAAGQEFEAFITKELPQETRPPGQEGLTSSQLSTAMSNIDLVKMWVKAVEEEVWVRLADGRGVPNFKLVMGKSNRRWRNEDEAISDLLLYGLEEDAIAPRSIKGIGAIEKMIKPKDREAMMKALTEKPPGRPTIAHASDPRPECAADAAADFANHLETNDG